MNDETSHAWLALVRASFREAVRSLMTAKQRTLLAVTGIVIGIGSVIGMVSIGEVVRVQALREFTDLGTDIVSVRAEGQGEGAGPAFDVPLVEALPDQVAAVRESAPFVNGSPSWLHRGKLEYVQYYGVNESFLSVCRIGVAEGRAISRLDSGRFFCVAGAKVAQLIRQRMGVDPIGASIQLDDRIYTVVGVLARLPDGGSIRPSGLNEGVLVPLATAVRALPGGRVETFMARVRPGIDAARLRGTLEAHFAARGKKLTLSVNAAEEIIKTMERQMALYTLLLGAVGSIALVVGGIGVMNVMLISVSERRSEIGVRRALGAQESDIRSQFLVEAIVLCFVGGLLGVVFGVGTAWIFARSQDYAFVVSGWAIVLGFFVSSAVGVFFGFYPARKASRLDPIQALRS